MSSSKNYPIVSRTDIIDLFHAALSWRAGDITHRFLETCFLSFNPFFKVLQNCDILPERRIEAIRDNKEFTKLFLERCHLVEGTDLRPIPEVMREIDHRLFLFVARVSSNELVSGKGLRSQELFSRKRVYITDHGRQVAPTAAERIKHLLTESQWNKTLQDMRDNLPPKYVLCRLSGKKNAALDEELYGYVPGR